MSKHSPTKSMIHPVAHGSEKIAIEDVDLTSESGWRELNPARVSDLLKEWKDGNYGLCIMKEPSIRCVNGKPKMSKEGKLLLADGKHKFKSLCEAKELYGGDSSDEQNWTAPLVDAMTNGVVCQLQEFPDDDDDIILAFQAAAHDETANKALWTDLKDFAAVAQRYKARTKGGMWPDVQKALEALYPGKRMLAYRMVAVACAIPDQILVAISERRLPASYFFENKFFLGSGNDKDKRISDLGRLELVAHLRDAFDAGAGMSKPVFMNEYCAPMRKGETWLLWLRRHYGAAADRAPTKRVEEYLRSSKARLPILGCMKAGVPLHGLSEEQPGIECCRLLVRELDQAKNPKKNPQDASGGSNNSADEAATNALAATPDALAATASADVEKTITGGLSGEDADPVYERAKSRLAKELMNISYTDSMDVLKSDLAARFLAGEPVIFMVDAQTSKPKISINLMEKVDDILKHTTLAKHCIMILCSRRMDLAVAVGNKAAVLWPQGASYTIQLNHGATQTQRKRPGYMVVVTSKAFNESGAVPVAIELGIVRRGEKIALRCLDRACPLRSEEERCRLCALTDAAGKDSTLPPTAELEPDDQDGEGLDSGLGVCVHEP